MKQLTLPGISPDPLPTIVNVASVQHRSPFRYPGGKTWLVPRIRQWLESLPISQRSHLVEPFAGGAIVGLSALFDGLVERVTLVEIDAEVAAVWDTIINRGEADQLATRILEFRLTPDSVAEALNSAPLTCCERAFQTILKNRINRGGILAPGAGQIKQGENGKGLGSRWYPATLARRIRDIDAIRHQLTFISGDGLDTMRAFQGQHGTVFFIDPPYTVSRRHPGSRLYTHHTLDHETLFSLARSLAGDFVMTYDPSDAIQNLAQKHCFEMRTVVMKNTHHLHQTELLIGRDLRWLD